MSAINDFHHKAMDLAALALMERAKGNPVSAARLFEVALENEIASINALEKYVEPTFSVLHRSAATLALDCEQYRVAEKLASKALAQDPPEAIAEDLREVLDQTHANLRRQLAGSDFLHPASASLTFSGKPVWGEQGILANFLAKALPAFEIAVASVGAGLNGTLGEMGPIPERDRYNLLITDVARGSFGFEFESATQDIRGSDRYSQSEIAVGTIRDILEESMEPMQESHGFAYAVSEVPERSLKHLAAFLDIVHKNDAVCALRFGDSEVRFHNSNQVKQSAERLGRIKREEEIELTGQFNGILPSNGRSEFLDESTGETIMGIARAPVIQRHKHIINRQVIVLARRRWIGTAKPRYTFLHILDR